MADTESRLYSWQKRLLPFLTGSIVILALIFFVFSFLQIKQINSRIETNPDVNLDSVFEKYEKNADNHNITYTESYMRWKTLIYIEKFAIDNRYHQANALLMSRILLIYLGFLTGMVLCFVGGTFILGKLSEKGTNLSADTSLWKVTLTSSSPGIILAIIGVLLMITTILSKSDITVKDTSLYVPSSVSKTRSADFPDFPSTQDSLKTGGTPSIPVDEDKEINDLKRKGK